MIEIKEVTDKKAFREFVKLPFKIYKGSPYWVPPIINDEVASFDKDINPAFLDATAKFFIAYKNGEAVGRIASIINWNEVNLQEKKKVRFGWWDVIDDPEITKALLDKVREMGQEHCLEYIEGPMGFSNLDKVGVMTEGFDHLGTMITWYNHPYYKDHLEQLGFVKEKEYLENKFKMKDVHPEYFAKAEALIRRRFGLTALTFKSISEVMPYVDKMFDLFNDSYASLASFVPITDIQKEYFKNKYIRFVNPEYIIYVEDKDHNLVAFSIVMPSYSRALQKANGSLFPFGLFHLLQAKKKSKDVIFYLIGVHPEYQNKGVTAIIMNEYYKVFTAKGIINCIRTPELEENKAIYNLWKNFNPSTHIRRRTYKKTL